MANVNHKIWRWGFRGVAAAALVSVICFNNADTVKWLGMVMMTATLGAGAWRFRCLRQRMNPVLLVLTLITAMAAFPPPMPCPASSLCRGFCI